MIKFYCCYLQGAAAGLVFAKLGDERAAGVAFMLRASSILSPQPPRPDTACDSSRARRHRFRRKCLSAHAHRGQASPQHDEDAGVEDEGDEERNKEGSRRRVHHVTCVRTTDFSLFITNEVVLNRKPSLEVAPTALNRGYMCNLLHAIIACNLLH